MQSIQTLLLFTSVRDFCTKCERCRKARQAYAIYML